MSLATRRRGADSSHVPWRSRLRGRRRRGGARARPAGRADSPSRARTSTNVADRHRPRSRRRVHAGRRRRQHDDSGGRRRRDGGRHAVRAAEHEDPGRHQVDQPTSRSATSSTRTCIGDHIGGNEAIAKAGRTRAGGNVVGDIGSAATETARIIAHENALNRMVQGHRADSPRSRRAPGRPRRSSTGGRTCCSTAKRCSSSISRRRTPTATSLVFFRRTDVLATGDLFTTVMYPFIDQRQRRHDQRLHRRAQRASSTSPCRATSTRAARWWCRAMGALSTSRTSSSIATW